MTDKSRIKIAVLGGGCGSMAALWGLMQSDDAQRYDVTVYQMGWRLGGKGASGRNRNHADRIEEHGLHIWSGMYENAFRMMRGVYAELNRAPEEPLSRWYDPEHPQRSAFLPHNTITLPEYGNGRWEPWTLEIPGNAELPGSGALLPEPSALIEEVLQGLIEAVLGADFLWEIEKFARHGTSLLPAWLNSALRSGASTLSSAPLLRRFGSVARTLLHRIHMRHLHDAHAAARLLPRDHRDHTAAHYAAVAEPLCRFKRWLDTEFADLQADLPAFGRVYLLVDLGTALIRGILEDDLMRRGVDRVDDQEFVGWLAKHGASARTLDSVLVRGWHAFFFATPDGPGGPRSLSAATGLRTLLRCVFTYKGAFFWKMQAGMGDVVFAPLYEVLSQCERITFKFFHKVEALHVAEGARGKKQIESIRVARQVDLAADRDHYAPLYDVGGLPCWPSEPLYEQLDPDQARTLRNEQINLESAWADWKPREHLTLEKGKDFDLVVLGIPPAALKPLTRQLEKAHKPWRKMLRKLASVQTQAMQLWLDPSPSELGRGRPGTVGTVYASPFNTWANMDHLLTRERWGDLKRQPKSLLYFCDTVADAQPIPGPNDVTFPTQQHERTRNEALTWLMSNSGGLWPGMAQPGTPAIDWALLTTKDPMLAGERRLNDQFWRINIDPSERYVLSLPGTAMHRLRADESGFENLFLAGDWLATGLNAGCVEAAVMGGLQASQAISGWPREIIGDGDFLRPDASPHSAVEEPPDGE